MRLPRLSPAGYRRLTLLAVVSCAAIIVTGGAVRLTQSGLGCPDWPTCAHNRVVAPWQYHAMVEFGNRLFTVLVVVAVGLAVVGALLRVPRRRDLLRLSLLLVAGVLAQVVLGGLTVLFKLAPGFVMAHLLVSMAVLWVAVVLHHRAGTSDRAPTTVVPGETVWLVRLLTAGVAVVIGLGTVVTGSGPHSGNAKASRLDFPFHAAAELHATVVIGVIGLTLATLFALHQARAPESVQRRGRILLEFMVAQGALGYVQYFTRVPALLVGIHIAGATAVWIATTELGLSLHHRPRELAAVPAAEPGPAAEVLSAS